jgi:hypothetical protein
MAEHIPPPAGLQGFAVLSRRFLDNCWRAYRWDQSDEGYLGIDPAHLPEHIEQDPHPALKASHRDLESRLDTSDVLSPFGWQKNVNRAIETIRSMVLHYFKYRFVDRKIKPDPNRDKAKLQELEKAIREIEAAVEVAGEAGLTNMPATPGGDKAIRLTARHELILKVFKDHGSGPFRWRRIAELAALEANAHLRTDLSNLKRLDYLDNDGRGYTRTAKPYSMS